jgi:DNA-binding NtrC family response regulator
MNPTKVLIVDDDPDIRHFFQKILTEMGYEVSTASGARESLTRIKRDPPDVLFLDIKMPKMDGLECLRRVRKIKRKLPIVMITGYEDLNSAQEAMRLGADEYVSKPFDLEEIRRLISELIGAN